jgi:hypothetical protein
VVGLGEDSVTAAREERAARIEKASAGREQRKGRLA